MAETLGMKEKSEQSNKALDELDNNELFDQLVDDINGFGWFQKRMWILSFVASILCGCNHLSPIYTAYLPKHQCASTGSFMMVTSFLLYNYCIN